MIQKATPILFVMKNFWIQLLIKVAYFIAKIFHDRVGDKTVDNLYKAAYYGKENKFC